MIAKIYFVLFLCLVGLCLINTNLFIHASIANYFAFVIGSGVLLLFTLGLIYKGTFHIYLSISSVLFLSWAFFPMFLKGLLHDKLYFASSGLLFLVTFLLIRRRFDLSLVFLIITVLACTETTYCLLQYFNVTNSNSEYFKITGSSFNPNITAMYLAMSLPAALYVHGYKPLKLPQSVYVIPFVLISLGIITLECRTAIIAVIMAMLLATGIFLYKKLELKYLFLTGMLLCGLLVPIGTYFYNIKKDSADGRLLVWKTSFKLIKEKPFSGYGVGLFEKEYNLKQAEFIRNKGLSEQESKTASYVNMAYNDYLEQAVEGGIPFVTLYLLVIISLLYKGLRKSKGEEKAFYFSRDVSNYSYLGVLIFAFMGFTNFTIKAIPVFCLFCIYAGCLSASSSQYPLKFKQLKHQKWCLVVIGICILILGNIQLKRARAHYQHKKAVKLTQKKKYSEALYVLQHIDVDLKDSEVFNKNYGNVLFKQGRVKEALSYFKHAQSISSSAYLYDRSSSCHYLLKDYEQAFVEIQQAAFLSPKKMLYKYKFMKMLEAQQQIMRAREVANEILQMKPLRSNAKVHKYQQEARRVLTKLIQPKRI